MTDETIAFRTLSKVRSRRDAFEWWQSNSSVVSGTTLIVSHEDPSTLVVPVRRRFGRTLQLLSIFASSHLTVLNERIVDETLRTGNAAVGVDSLIGFDTNAASYLRGLFTH